MTLGPLTEDGFYSPLSWTTEQLADIARQIDPVTPVDLGIVRAVKILLDAGISTYESCQGGEGHCYPEPTVRFEGHPATGWRALALLMTYDLPVKRFSRTWTFSYERVPEGPVWEVVFRRPLG